jgi:hypothetical protein
MKPLLLVLALAAALPAFAQTQVRRAQVYRCGPDGRDLRDSPCPGGAAPAGVDYDEPSAADSRAARDRHLADAKQAAAMAAARRASESAGHLPEAAQDGQAQAAFRRRQQRRPIECAPLVLAPVFTAGAVQRESGGRAATPQT